MERIRICTVVTGKTLHEFMDNLEVIQQVADFIELRVDHLKHIALDDIELMKRKITCPAIFTCRKKAEGGLYEGSEPERMAILEKACAMAFDYIDIEVASAEKFDFSKKGQTKIIVSFHDFTKTPALQELEALKIRMKSYPVDVMKFAVFINQNEDRMTMIKLLLNKEIDEEMIVIGMGDQGKILRIIAPLLDSYLTFASTPFSQSAAGQIDISELQQLYTLIENMVSKKQRKERPYERSDAYVVFGTSPAISCLAGDAYRFQSWLTS
jgi:3-dehydroquinate dehydratase type I